MTFLPFWEEYHNNTPDQFCFQSRIGETGDLQKREPPCQTGRRGEKRENRLIVPSANRYDDPIGASGCHFQKDPFGETGGK
ncbi:hypothetical protein LFML04_1017 [Leptospirillum ferriphilum ML-04]|nr:hypothetical protein LFML04_1017 [Leptospirillum ferriphilum ML-04]